MQYAKPKQEPTLLQHYLPFLLYAKPSTPTNIRQSNPPNQLATYCFGSFLNKNPPVLATHFILYYPHSDSPHSPVNTQSYSCQIHCSTFHAAARRLLLHLYALAVWHCTLKATKPSMNLRTLRSPHYRAPTQAHRLLKRTCRNLVTH